MSKQVRCFVAVEIPDNIKKEIDSYILNLKKISPEIKWVKARAIHITLKFLGEIEPEICSQVKSALTGISEVSDPFELKISESGAFPNFKRPRVLWLGLQQDSNKSLFRLHEWIDKKLSPIGFEREKRRFSPHLTLGRVKNPGNFNELFDFIKNNKFRENAFKVLQVVLMQSELKPTGAVYTPLQIYKL